MPQRRAVADDSSLMITDGCRQRDVSLVAQWVSIGFESELYHNIDFEIDFLVWMSLDGA